MNTVHNFKQTLKRLQSSERVAIATCIFDGRTEYTSYNEIARRAKSSVDYVQKVKRDLKALYGWQFKSGGHGNGYGIKLESITMRPSQSVMINRAKKRKLGSNKRPSSVDVTSKISLINSVFC